MTTPVCMSTGENYNHMSFVLPSKMEFEKLPNEIHVQLMDFKPVLFYEEVRYE